MDRISLKKFRKSYFNAELIQILQKLTDCVFFLNKKKNADHIVSHFSTVLVNKNSNYYYAIYRILIKLRVINNSSIIIC